MVYFSLGVMVGVVVGLVLVVVFVLVVFVVGDSLLVEYGFKVGDGWVVLL